MQGTGHQNPTWLRTSFHLQIRPFSQDLGVKNSLRPCWPGLLLSGKLGVRNNIVSREGADYNRKEDPQTRGGNGSYRLRQIRQVVQGGEEQAAGIAKVSH